MGRGEEGIGVTHMNRKQTEAARIAAYRQVEKAPQIQWEWWLDEVTVVRAGLSENNTHAPSHYFAEPWFVAEHVYSDSGRTDREHPVTVNSLDGWKLPAFIRLRDEWLAWAANKRDDLQPETGCPSMEIVGGKTVARWPNGNPWPEAAAALVKDWIDGRDAHDVGRRKRRKHTPSRRGRVTGKECKGS